jgi:O-antigen/teichoic acid export membrane protein
LRAGALGGRFALSVALVRWLPMSDVGLFGLLAGIAGAAPTLMGLGVNYFFARDAAHARGGEAASLMRDRLALTGIAIAGAALAMSALAATGIVEWPPHAALFCAIVAFEVVALDMHMGLVGMDRSTTAGALLFVRSAAWIPAWAMLAWACPSLRGIGSVLWAWAWGLGAWAAGLAWALRDLPWKQASATPVRPGRFFARSWRGMAMVYASDIGLAGSAYADRFLVCGRLGLAETGTYVFFWTIANAMQLLVNTAVSQTSFAALVRARAGSGRARWDGLYRHTLLEAFACGALVSACILAAARMALPSLGRPEAEQGAWMLAPLLVAALGRAGSDIADNGLCSLGLDANYALTNFAGFALTLATCLWGVTSWGLPGLCAAQALAAWTAFGARCLVLRRGSRTAWT